MILKLKKNGLLSYNSDKIWLKNLAYLAEIFERFKAKGYKHHPASRRIWKHFIQSCKTDFISNARNVAMFEKLSSIVEKSKELAKNLKISTIDHLQSLEIEFHWYFSELKEEDAFLRNSYSTSPAIADILDEVQDLFCDLGNDSSAHDTLHEMLFSWFWWAVRESHPHRSELAFRILLSMPWHVSAGVFFQL